MEGENGFWKLDRYCTFPCALLVSSSIVFNIFLATIKPLISECYLLLELFKNLKKKKKKIQHEPSEILFWKFNYTQD